MAKVRLRLVGRRVSLTRPLLAACLLGQESVADMLLVRGRANPDCRGLGGSTPLLVAAEAGHVGCVELLLARGARPDVGHAHTLKTALWLAARADALPVARALLAYRAGVDMCDMTGFSPLMLAAKNKSADMARLLLDCKADAEKVRRGNGQAVCVCV